MSRVTGASDLQARFSRLSANIQAEVKEIVEVNTGDLELEAIRNAPGTGDEIRTKYGYQNETDIRNSKKNRLKGWVPINDAIGYEITNNKLTGVVFVEKSAGDLAAWVEFSTGQSAKTYLATVPAKWREEARKYFITGRGTIIGKPYMLPAFFKYSVIFKKELKDLFKRTRL